MDYDKALVASKIHRWTQYFEQFHFPAWEDIPDIGLYMDQLLRLMQGYFCYLPPEARDGDIVTAAAVHNYVRKKLMPEPFRKKYYRVHIVYLLIICSLKRCTSLSTLQAILPSGLSADSLRQVYGCFTDRFQQVLRFLQLEIGPYITRLFSEEDQEKTAEGMTDLIIASAIVTGFAGLLTEKILMLNQMSLLGDTAPQSAGSPS